MISFRRFLSEHLRMVLTNHPNGPPGALKGAFLPCLHMFTVIFIVFTCIVLGIAWDKACDKPLKWFLLTWLLLQVLTTAIYCLSPVGTLDFISNMMCPSWLDGDEDHHVLASKLTPERYRGPLFIFPLLVDIHRISLQMTEPVAIYYTLFLVAGHAFGLVAFVWVLDSHTCRETAPHLYALVFFITVFQLTVFWVITLGSTYVSWAMWLCCGLANGSGRERNRQKARLSDEIKSSPNIPVAVPYGTTANAPIATPRRNTETPREPAL